MKRHLLALVLAAACTTTGLAAPGDPVVIGSPAWHALMARDAGSGEQPAFHAAELLNRWGRRDEADALRRALLLRHLQARAGDPLADTTLGRLMDAGTPSLAELDRALARAAPRAGGAPWPQTTALDDEAVRHIADAMGLRPPADWAGFVSRHADCRSQGTCPPRSQPAPSNADPDQAWREQQRRDQQARADRALRQRMDRFALAWLAAYVLAGLLVHLLLARFVGRWVAVAVTLAIGPVLSIWLLKAHAPQPGWGGLALAILVMALTGGALVLAPLFDAVHRRFFAQRGS